MRASWGEPKRSGNSGRYLSVLKWASEKGLSVEVYGRLWVLVTPRSPSSNASDLDVMLDPRSACSVSWSRTIPCLSTDAVTRRRARAADSRWATIQPTT